MTTPQEIVNKELDIAEIFKNYIKIEPKVVAIETLFNNPRRRDKTNYTPPYQRNYVWDTDKASYFIESILLGTEIPPLVFFNSGDLIEVIDGRQRYETILKFVNNEFKLRKGGLLKLKDLARKNFDGLKELRDTIWDTKLRIIEFSFHAKPAADVDVEDLVKKEIFKRYNSGITPLKPTEIDKAKYIDDDLNSHFKKFLLEDARGLALITDVFQFEKSNIEVLLKRIRQLLVLHQIPISYYANAKNVVSKFYELLSEKLETDFEIDVLFNSFIKKVNLLKRIKSSLQKQVKTPNRLFFECLFWAFSILEEEGLDINVVQADNTESELVNYLAENAQQFRLDRSHFPTLITERYNTTAAFFEARLGINFSNYLKNYEGFKELNRRVGKEDKTDTETLSKFESLRLNKPDASSFAIDDITRQMKNNRFVVRPVYQRKEVINKLKSSSIIESILLGIKLPPIFVYKRSDGVSEVVDGQQRLLSILGYLGVPYLDENRNLAKSEKDKYSLSLKNGILKELSGKNFDKLPEQLRDRILNYDLWIIEIDYKNNQHFDPVDLFIRLNYKPYPIKENTFEMWNSYVDRKIIGKIKGISASHEAWLYLRKNNVRMENEGLLTFLMYLDHKTSGQELDFMTISPFLDIYVKGEKINFRLKAKSDITKLLESAESRDEFLATCSRFEDSFLKKVTELIKPSDQRAAGTLNSKFDELMSIEKSQRRNWYFYALWLLLSKIDYEKIMNERAEIFEDVKAIMREMTNIESKEKFESIIEGFWFRHS